MRHRLFFIFLALLPAIVTAQTAKTRASLYTEIDTNLASGQPITALMLRNTFKNVVASADNGLSDGTGVTITGSYANPSWLTSLSWSKLTGLPTTLSGYGITDGLATSAIGTTVQAYDADLANIAALSTTSFGRSLLTQADAAATRSTIGAGTSNFDGVFASLTSKPTTLSGYGITDSVTAAALVATNPSGINVGGKVHWTQLMGVPAGFADGTDDGAGGGGGNVSNSGTPTSGQVAEWVTSSTIQGVATTGSGNYVRANSPALTTPNLGTPTAVTLTNATGLPVATGISGLGTGVATALSTNVGTAGAAVVNGGALGTPSSGNVANLTGTASININGTVGATTPSTGAFTTLNTSGQITRSGVLASSPAIAVSGTDTVSQALLQVGTNTADGGSVGSRLVLIDAGTSGKRWDIASGYVAGAFTIRNSTDAVLPLTLTNTGLNATAIGATTPSMGAFTTVSSTLEHTFTEQSAPSTPASNKVVLYAKSDGRMYSKDDAGTETQLGTSSGMSNPMTTAGDIIIGGSSGTPTHLPIGSSGQVLKVVSGAPAWAAESGGGGSAFAPASGFQYYTDFVAGWTDFQENAFGGSSGSLSGEQGRPGIVYLRDGSSSGYAARRWLQSTSSSDWIQFTFGGGEFVFETSIKITAVNSMDKIRFGFQDDEVHNSVTDGIYFEVNSSNQLMLVTVNNGSATTSSTLATLTTGTWYRIAFVVNSAGTSVQAYVNGSSSGSPNTSNIPTSRVTGLSYAIRKAGSAAYSEVAIDYCFITQTLSR